MKKLNFLTQKAVLIVLIIGLSTSLIADESDYIYDDTRVHEYYLTFSQDNFYEILESMYAEHLNQYLMADFEYEGVVYEDVGVRFKGYKSMGYPGQKKPFLIKFDEFYEEQEFYGVNKLSLSNEYSDPSFLREKLAYDLMNDLIPSPRANFVKLYINGDYWGLYTNVEKVNMRFIDRQFGNSENGNLYKGDPCGNLVWYGNSQEDYDYCYELKTNEDENDWSDLINFIDVLNHCNDEDYVESMEELFQMNNFLFFSAINNFMVNLDSYNCNIHNYYLYHRTDSGKFIHIPWDFNYSFGNYSFGLSQETLRNLPVFWQHPQVNIPLVNRTFQFEKYQTIYIECYEYLIENVFKAGEISDRIDYLADLIRPAVYADNQKMFTNEDFETNLVNDVIEGNRVYPGLKSFIYDRISSVSAEMETFTTPETCEGIHINEFMAKNNSFRPDESGEFEDWIEIYNENDYDVDLTGCFLSDDPSNPEKWQFPDISIKAKEYLLVWADNDRNQGPLHTNFNLNGDGEYISFCGIDGVIPRSEIFYPEQFTDVSYGRYSNSDGDWKFFVQPSPMAKNCYYLANNVFINELLADNNETYGDEYHEFEDWIELYNDNPREVDLSNLYLTDDPDELDKWQLPDISIPANDFLVLWADNDIDQGPLHCGFKLSGNGEFVILSDGLTIIDSVAFGNQYADISYGRCGDGCDDWTIFMNPTPGSMNQTRTYTTPNTVTDKFNIHNFPNPFNPETTINYQLKEDSFVSLKIFNVKGQLVRTLVEEHQKNGDHSILWNGADDNRKAVSSGIYFYKIKAGDHSVLNKMVMAN